jgi:hypothetical protein
MCEQVATTVVYKKDINRTSAQTPRKNQHLGDRGICMGEVFVQTLTDTDTKANGMVNHSLSRFFISFYVLFRIYILFHR